MLTGLFLGAGNSGDCFVHGLSSSDDGTEVLARLVSNRVAPGGGEADVLVTQVSVVVSANASASFKMIPIVDDVRYDGGMAQDCSVEFDVTGDGTSLMPMTSWIPVAVGRTYLSAGGVPKGAIGLRGTWFQFELVGTEPVGLDVSGELGTVFLEGVVLDFALISSMPTPLPGAGGTTPNSRTPGYASTPTW